MSEKRRMTQGDGIRGEEEGRIRGGKKASITDRRRIAEGGAKRSQGEGREAEKKREGED